MSRIIFIIYDAVIIAGSYIITLLIRYSGNFAGVANWWSIITFSTLAVILTYSYYGLYDNFLYTQRFLVVFNIIKAWLIVCLAYGAVAYLSPFSFLPRDIGLIVLFFAVGLVLQFIGRVIVAEKIRKWYFASLGTVRISRYRGPETACSRISKFFEDHPFIGIRIADDEDVGRHADEAGNIFVYSTADSFQKLYEDIMSNLTQGGNVYVASPLFTQLRFERKWNSIDGIPLCTFSKKKYPEVSDVVSRLLDILVSIGGLVTLSPFFIIISIAIKLDSKGPVIYKQQRCGKNGRIFTFYKFRSMYKKCLDAEASVSGGGGALTVPIPKEETLSQKCVTRVGKFLRRASIDEWPQLWNVLKGDMSLVGPRPHCPAEVALYENWHKDRLLVNQGLTGMWQVYGRGDMPCDKSIFLDLIYVINRSVSLDIRLLMKTIPVVILGKGAY
jgi:exopolysaccharide biosynthesis polyprenyl glycosylphosphotransferase